MVTETHVVTGLDTNYRQQFQMCIQFSTLAQFAAAALAERVNVEHLVGNDSLEGLKLFAVPRNLYQQFPRDLEPLYHTHYCKPVVR